MSRLSPERVAILNEVRGRAGAALRLPLAYHEPAGDEGEMRLALTFTRRAGR